MTPSKQGPCSDTLKIVMWIKSPTKNSKNDYKTNKVKENTSKYLNGFSSNEIKELNEIRLHRT